MAAAIVIFFLGLTAAQAPPPVATADVLQYAPPDADVVLYTNFDGLVGPGWRWITDDFAKQPFVAASPELERSLAEGIAQLQQGVVQGNALLGLDVLADVHYAIAWVKPTDLANESADFLVVVRGEFPSDFLGRFAGTMSLSQTKTKGGATLWLAAQTGPGNMVTAVAQRGNDLLFGNASWVEARVDGSYRPGDPKPGTLNARVADAIKQGPLIAAFFEPGALLRKAIDDSSDSKSARDILGGFQWFDVVIRADGIDFDLQASSDDLFVRYKMVLEGFTDLCRASQTATRGLVRGGLGIVTADDPAIEADARALFQERDAVLAFVEANTGDGTIRLIDNSAPRSRRLRLSLRANHVREILSPTLALAAAAGSF